MIKKIKIVNHDNHCVRDTTIGKVYDVTHDEVEDSLSFFDDEGDDVMIRVSDPACEVVEEEQSMTNNNQVNWDEIPEDVEAVVTYSMGKDTFFKKEGGKLYSQLWRHSIYKKSGWDEYNEVSEYYGDRFHLRPSPITKPTPVPPESPQVETTEVEATTTPEFDWSSVEDDVEAVIVSNGEIAQWLKSENGCLLRTNSLGKVNWSVCYYKTLDDREKHMCDYHDKEAKLLRRPPATTPPPEKVTCKVEFYEGELPEGMILFDSSSIQTETYIPKPPSISTILQEAQQSILKHHGVTGEVSFTVACS